MQTALRAARAHFLHVLAVACILDFKMWGTSARELGEAGSSIYCDQ